MAFDTLAPAAVAQRVAANLEKKGYAAAIVPDGAAALERVQALIPKGAAVMNGASRTLQEIGYLDYLKSGKHGWRDLHAEVNAEKDAAKRAAVRKQATLSDYYVGSVHALIESGEFIIASNTGSQLPHVAFTSPNLIFVVSTKKLVASMADGMRRLEEHVVPLEDQNMRTLYQIGTQLSKILIVRQENIAFSQRKLTFLLVNQNLGF